MDIVRLYRRLTGVTGYEVLEEIRYRPWTSSVGMVTAVEPDFANLELGLVEYLPEPVSIDELHDTVET